jgi:hypothetical protein
MFPLAATALEKIKEVPTTFWINVGIAVLLLITLVIVLRKLANVNKVVLAVAGTVAITGLGFSWVYERDEPKFMTPYVEKIAPLFLPKPATRPSSRAPRGLKPRAPRFCRRPKLFLPGP